MLTEILFRYTISLMNTQNISKVYTPEEVAGMLKVTENAVYKLINSGEIVAKKVGDVYRIPGASIYYIFTGLDYDLYKAEKEDKKNIPLVGKELSKVRSEFS